MRRWLCLAALAGAAFSGGVLRAQMDLPAGIPEGILRQVGTSRRIYRPVQPTLKRAAAQAGSHAPVRATLERVATAGALYQKLAHTTLFAAAAANDLYAIDTLLDRGIRINGRNKDRATALHVAAVAGHAEAVRLLIGRGASMIINEASHFSPAVLSAAAAGQFEITALMQDAGAPYSVPYAIYYGDIEAVKQFIEDDPSLLHTPSPQETTLVFKAASANQLEIAEYLIDRGCPTAGLDIAGDNLLYYAVRPGHKEMVRLLVSKGVSPNSRMRDDNTAIHREVLRGDPHGMIELPVELGGSVNLPNEDGQRPLHMVTDAAIAQLLLDKRAKVGGTDKEGRTALHYAAERGLPEIAALLLDNGAGVSKTDKRRQTPLHLAALNGHRPVVDLLFEQGAEPTEKDAYSWNPVHFACEGGHTGLVELFWSKGNDLETPTRSRLVPLHLAARAGRAPTVSFLLNKGVAVDPRDFWKKTPLYMAMENDRLETGVILVGAGADVNAATNAGQTPLFPAARVWHTGLVSLMLNHDADVGVVDTKERTALHEAAQFGCPAVVKLLLLRGARVNLSDLHMETPLTLAAARSNVLSLQRLIEASAEVNARREDGRTPVLIAAENGKTPVLRRLLREGGKITTTDNQGNTPLHLACANGHASTMALLLDRQADLHVPNRQDKTPLALAEERLYHIMIELNDSAARLGAKGFAEIVKDMRVTVAGDVVRAAASGDFPRLRELLSLHPFYVDAKRHYQTLLQTAILGDDVDMAKLLVLHGADTNIVDALNRTPLEMARALGREEIAEILDRYMSVILPIFPLRRMDTMSHAAKTLFARDRERIILYYRTLRRASIARTLFPDFLGLEEVGDLKLPDGVSFEALEAEQTTAQALEEQAASAPAPTVPGPAGKPLVTLQLPGLKVTEKAKPATAPDQAAGVLRGAKDGAPGRLRQFRLPEIGATADPATILEQLRRMRDPEPGPPVPPTLPPPPEEGTPAAPRATGTPIMPPLPPMASPPATAAP